MSLDSRIAGLDAAIAYLTEQRDTAAPTSPPSSTSALSSLLTNARIF